MIFSKLRSLIFKLDPEVAHDLAIKSLKLKILPEKKINSQSSISTVIFGKTIDNPVGIAAGFDKDAEVYNSLFKLGFGFVEVGTVTPIKQYGNPKPRVFRLEEDQALINRLGFNSSGAEKVYTNISSNLPNGLFGINIGPNKESKNRFEDYLVGLRRFHKIADYLTINISSPNTEDLRKFHNEEELYKLLNLIINEKNKLKTKIPIAVKVSPDLNDENIDKISELLLKFKIDAAIISNTTEKNRESLNNINKVEKGGLSGKPIEKMSNIIINKFFNKLDNKVKIIGVGGVDSGLSAYEKFLHGASAVQLYTGMVYQGPDIAYKIGKDLIQILKNKNIKSISSVIGKKNNLD